MKLTKDKIAKIVQIMERSNGDMIVLTEDGKMYNREPEITGYKVENFGKFLGGKIEFPIYSDKHFYHEID